MLIVCDLDSRGAGWSRMVFLAFFLLVAVGAGRSFAADAAHPNIILILADDMGYGDIGPFGSTLNRTPNLDEMAKEGMKLTSFYAAPVCSASRAQILTGCYAPRVSIPGVLSPASKKGLNPSENTVASLLKEQGYATMIIGKWHLGDQPGFLPLQHGFEHYLGLPYSNDMLETAAVTGVPVVPLIQDNKVIELITDPEQDLLTERYTNAAVKFITENRDHPFFLYLAHCAVHVPLHPGKKFQGKSANGKFGDWVEETDWSVGQVLDALRSQKLDSKTLVIFTSDNGPWLIKGKDAGTAAPLRGGKFTTWEGGEREPFVAWWPGHIPAGVVRDTVAANIDFLPTFVSLAGGSVPDQPEIDGRNISPLLLGQAAELPDDVFFYYNYNDLDAVREGPWKLALRPQMEVVKYHGAGGQIFPPDAATSAPRLYNLDHDIGEKTNVAAQNPDVVARLTVLYKAMSAKLGNGKPGPGVRPPGIVDNPQMLYPVINKKPASEKASDTSKNAPASSTLVMVAAQTAPAEATLPSFQKAAFRATEDVVEQRVDAGAVQIRGTILRVVYASAAESNGYLVHIDSSDKTPEAGKDIMIVQARDGLVAGEKWPGPAGKSTIYYLGTTKYTDAENQLATVPLYVPDRSSAIVWTLSQ